MRNIVTRKTWEATWMWTLYAAIAWMDDLPVGFGKGDAIILRVT